MRVYGGGTVESIGKEAHSKNSSKRRATNEKPSPFPNQAMIYKAKLPLGPAEVDYAAECVRRQATKQCPPLRRIGPVGRRTGVKVGGRGSNTPTNRICCMKWSVARRPLMKLHALTCRACTGNALILDDRRTPSFGNPEGGLSYVSICVKSMYPEQQQSSEGDTANGVRSAVATAAMVSSKAHFASIAWRLLYRTSTLQPVGRKEGRSRERERALEKVDETSKCVKPAGKTSWARRAFTHRTKVLTAIGALLSCSHVFQGSAL